jgi:hypothetical protein
MKSIPSSVRLYAILARTSPLAVIFRRGPSKSVLLLKWDTSNDTFEQGQWLKGRIYERRCDLSPGGDFLLYFAANYRKPLRSWSAVSRPPFLTALALWPKGDGWGGGGHFLSDNAIALNHRDDEMNLGEGFAIPERFTVTSFGNRPGWGEDDPVWFERLKRDGWTLTSFPERTKNDFGTQVWKEFDPPIKWVKRNPKWPQDYAIEMSIIGLSWKGGPWYVTEHAVIGRENRKDKIGRSDWADWSQSGDLLFAMDGCIYRAPCGNETLTPLVVCVKQIDVYSGSGGRV